MISKRTYRIACLVAIGIMWLLTSVVAQTVYQCDFEDAQERSQWVLNAAEATSARRMPENRWYMGALGNNSDNGQYGLYVATRSDSTALRYTTNNTMFTVAYRTLTLQQGEYDLTFDWIGMLKNNASEGTFVYWVPDTMEVVSMNALGLLEWMQRRTYKILADTVPLYNAGIWKSCKAHISVTEPSETRRLMFVFTSSVGRATEPSFALDNIEIAYESHCLEPINIAHTINADGTVTLSWRTMPGIEKYEARIRDLQTGAIQSVELPRTGTMVRWVISGLEEGAQSVQVRSICGEQHSMWVPYDFLFFTRGERCVDYMLLDASTCSYQLRYASAFVDGQPTLPKTLEVKGAVDHGYDDYATTFHTLHYMPNEYDKYTVNQLRTKPEDALASVRIGRIGPTHVSRVSYKYKVPADEDQILVLRYALVLPCPHPEQPEANPIFVMETLVDGKPITNECGRANFTSGWGEATGWNFIPASENPNYDHDIYWNDWTTVSINIKEYAGKTITVSFSTTGCTLGAHGGYGYLTLSCETGQMSGMNCGEDNPTTTFIAPAGFDYRWWQESRDDVLGTRREYQIAPMDTSTYHVDLISKANANCFHTLDVSGIPRLPGMDAKFEKMEERQCQNVATFSNNSFIQYKASHWEKNIDGDSTLVIDRQFTRGERLTNIVWDWGDGSEMEHNADSIVEHVFPKYGGQYDVKMYATLPGASGDCFDSIVMPVTVPTIGIADRDFDVPIGYYYPACDKYPQGRVYFNEEHDTISEMIGYCERITYIHVRQTKFTVDTAFCEGGYYMLGDERVTSSVTGKTATLKSHQYFDVDGNPLDSVVTLNLHVEPLLKIEVDSLIAHCADEDVLSIPYKWIEGIMDTLVVRFDEKAQAAGFAAEYGFAPYSEIKITMPKGVDPGRYVVTLDMGSDQCPVPPIDLVVEQRFAPAVIAEKEGILAVLNTDYNGGYELHNFQWYRNGEPIDGATDSYIVLGDGDIGAEYYVTMSIEGDSLMLNVCPVIYTARHVNTGLDSKQIIAVHPTIVSPTETIYVSALEEFEVVNVLGQIVSRYSASTKSFVAPSTKGIYVIRFVQSNKTIKFLVR